MDRSSELRLARQLFLGLQLPNVELVKSLSDRKWMFFEFKECSGLQVTPTGLAVVGAIGNLSCALHLFKKAVREYNWSYEFAAALLTGVPRELLTDANRAHDRYSIEEIIIRLMQGTPLIEHGSGPKIIDRLSESQG